MKYIIFRCRKEKATPEADRADHVSQEMDRRNGSCGKDNTGIPHMPVAGYRECYRHIHPETGASIVVEDVGGELLHAGKPDFAYRSVSDRNHDVADHYTNPPCDPQTRRTMI